ncbi:hypothetical protein DSO57_1015836 [Entomophthora muscae]|uniref:Uncharacterized protein n=1 Tax=Entomophthora muscae TaxID=34485 RepID=A0ACC2TGB5_9FUNG|nr:hypothetical protein DSO57_1015836 [Entomophthora muscae]
MHFQILENDTSFQLVPDYGPGHTLGTGEQEPHKEATLRAKIQDLQSTLQDAKEKIVAQEITIREHREGMVHCETLIKCLNSVLRGI